MHTLNTLKIQAKTSSVLGTLQENREKHKQVVKEARVGYLDAAKKELAKRLEQLASGKLVSLTFSLSMPQDYTNVYDTAIEMLKMHTEQQVELDSSQVRSLIQDQWDWKRVWTHTNSAYSATARGMLDASGSED